ncbi:hypothetical protein KCE64_005400 [Salmonella enterica subsp. enterica serovar Hvittingfoss]|nr:hypothetical protein [Salmonella enterica subsp. enterica serovar Hvittingfoss]EHL2852849.1 hypothetical protein [Salmonella enterica subsp. enterica serovar Hvittingfoss]
MITVNSNTLGAQPGQSAAPDLADLIAGKFGLLHAKDAPECADLDTAIVGYMKVTPATKNNPQTGELAYGNLRTLDSLGCGDDGARMIPPTGSPKEWVMQIVLMADGSLYTRCRINDGAFGAFIKRW